MDNIRIYKILQNWNKINSLIYRLGNRFQPSLANTLYSLQQLIKLIWHSLMTKHIIRTTEDYHYVFYLSNVKWNLLNELMKLVLNEFIKFIKSI